MTPSPEVHFTLGEIAQAVDGRLQGPAERRPRRVSIDSRQVTPGDLFVPLVGAHLDGHDFIEPALRAGAAAFLAARESYARRAHLLEEAAHRSGAAFIVVEDTLRAIQALAAWHLGRLVGLVRVGVTGSNGKTTTKELIGAALAGVRRTATSPGNLNSETGLPLSAFLVRPGTEVAVFEMAMNHPGEIRDLAAIVRPEYALITNIGLAHVGFCGSQERIAAEKKGIFSFFSGRETAILPAHDRFYKVLAEGVRGRIVPYGPGSTRGFLNSEERGLDGSTIHWEGLRIRLPLVGRHNVMNALAAITVASELGAPPDRIRDALESSRPLAGRSEILRGRVTVIADFYNSSPESAREILDLVRDVPRAGRRFGVFGSMLELGVESGAEHEKLGRGVVSAGFDAIWFFGADARSAFEAARRLGAGESVRWSEDHAELGREVASAVREGDLVVLKGSRGMELERLLPVLLGDGAVASAHPAGGETSWA